MDQIELHYCRKGHLLPARGHRVEAFCPICGAPFDPAYQPSDTVSSPEHEQESPQVATAPTQFFTPQQNNTVQPAPFPPIVTGADSSPSYQPFSPRPVYSPSPQADHPMPVRPVFSRPTPISIAQPPIVQPQQASIPTFGVQLIYFEQKIDIPFEEAWLGRDGLGAEWFDGNLNISRRHVKIRANEQGNLIVGPDTSLNGTTYSVPNSDERIPVSKTDSVTLQAGDVLWVYNIPLEVK